MENWEYMVVSSEETNSGTEVTTVSGPDYRPQIIDPDGSDHDELRVFDQLGRQGWELVNVQETANWSKYWLKRPVAEPGGGWGTSV